MEFGGSGDNDERFDERFDDGSFDVTATKEGTFLGKCAELCGTYHAAMVFYVEVVPVEEYNARIKELAETGQDTAPIIPQFPQTGPKTEG